MKSSQIQVGKTYRNAARGTTSRKVLEIIPADSSNETRVRYTQIGGPWDGQKYILGMPSFAAWAGAEVEAV